MIKKLYHFLNKERDPRNIWAENRKKQGIIVSYHYVNSRNDGFWGNLHKLKTEEFKSQVIYFKERGYNFINLGDYVDFLYGLKKIPDNFCVLTFDDGLRDHYDNVFPILKEFSIKGCFFPLIKTLNGEILPVHKIHILLADPRLSAEEFAKDVNENLKQIAPEQYEKFKIDDVRKTGMDRQKRMDQKYEMDGVIRTNLKYNLATIEDWLKNKILNNIFKKYFKDENNVAKEFYLSAEQIKEMEQAGMEFGGHTLNHPRLALLSREEKQKEILEAKKILEDVLNKNVNVFSYPFGSYDGETFELLKEAGFRAAVTIKARENIGLVDPFLIKRMDTRDFS